MVGGLGGGMNIPVLTFLVILPAIGAVLLMLIPGKLDRVIKWTALSFSVLALAISIGVFLGFDKSEGGIQFAESYNWLAIPGTWGEGARAITFSLGVDGISVAMVLLTGIVMFTGTVVSWNLQNSAKDFFILYFLLLSGVFGVFVSFDMFFFFFFYELSVLPMYLLIGKWGSSSVFPSFSRSKEYSAMKLTIVLVAGSVLIWVSIVAIYVQAGIGTFDILEIQKVVDDRFSSDFQKLFFPMMMIGFGILAGLWPFHTWSPDGHVSAPTAVSMVHAGVLMKLGAFGIIRLGIMLMPEGAQMWMPLLIALGAVNVIYGAISAMGQTDLKYVIGYSSVSHMGYVLMGIGTLNTFGMNGAVLQMFSHGVMTALFFAVVGMIYERTHTRDSIVLEGMAKRMGVVGSLFVIAGLTSLGLPGLSGFVAELLVFIGIFQSYGGWGIVLGSLAVLGAAITAVYILRLIAKVFFGPIGDRWVDQTDANMREKFAAGVLVIVILSIGLWPFPYIEVIESGVSPLLAAIPGAG